MTLNQQNSNDEHEQSSSQAVEEKSKRMIFMWLCVIVIFAAIIFGWVYFIKRNFTKINSEINQGVGTFENITDDFRSQIKSFENIFNEQPATISNSVIVPKSTENVAQDFNDKVKEEIKNKELESKADNSNN